MLGVWGERGIRLWWLLNVECKTEEREGGRRPGFKLTLGVVDADFCALGYEI